VPPQTDTEALRNSLTREVTNDAYAISSQIFKGQEPDVARVSNEQVDARYRQAFSTNDRSYLQQEAVRDPVQFMASMQRLGVTMPAGQEITPDPKLPKDAKANVPLPKPPESATQTTYDQLQQVPAPAPVVPLPQPAPAVAMPPPVAPGGPPPLAAPPVAMPPPPGVIPAMAEGGVVTQPTVALIGEQGPEAVVPLAPTPTPQESLERIGGTIANPSSIAPQGTEIQQYIEQSARARGIDPVTALSVAYNEGGLTNPAARGTFKTGSSWWPFQLHYGGPGYEQYGTTAGMGNEFTAQTGYQPGDPAAWRASVDFALDQALKRGWYPGWYGSVPAHVSQWQGLPGRAA
jgi:hypothetical protein